MKRSKKMIKLKRSEAFYKIQNNYEDEDKLDPDFLNEILDILESAGVEFAPEEPEPSAVEKYKKLKDSILHYDYDDWAPVDLFHCMDSVIDELQARISDLESQVNIIADENQSLEKCIEEKDVEIEKLKKQQNETDKRILYWKDAVTTLQKMGREKNEQLPESPELVRAREEYEKWKNGYDGDGQQTEIMSRKGFSKLVIFKDALESENARLRGIKQ
jgi:chromosome segregation ATPase